MSRHRDISVFLGDIHAPFQNDKAILQVFDFLQGNSDRIKIVGQVGDARDCLSWSRWPVYDNPFTPRQEWEFSSEILQDIWDKIKKIAPRAKRIQFTGNHDERPLKLLARSAPELSPLVDPAKILNFSGVETVDYREDYEIEDFVVKHGWLSKPGDHTREYQKNVVFGHTHKLWVHTSKFGSRQNWEISCGFLGDASSPAFSYTQQRKYARYQHGFAYVDAFGPHVVPIYARDL